MSHDVKICDISDDVKMKLKSFRFRKEKNIAAIVLKIDPEKLLVVEDETFEDITFDELKSELPEHNPRYVVLSYVYHHDDNRISFPLCFIHISPAGCKPQLHMMYAGTYIEVQNVLGLTKTFEVRDIEEFTEEWLKTKLKFFG